MSESDACCSCKSKGEESALGGVTNGGGEDEGASSLGGVTNGGGEDEGASSLGGVTNEGEGFVLGGAEEREAGSGSEVDGERTESAGYLVLSLVEDVPRV